MSYFDDIEDTLDAQPVSTGPAPDVSDVDGAAARQAAAYSELCKKCGGSGRVMIGYRFPRAAQCFACKGGGRKTFKTSPDHRAKVRGNAQASKEAKAAAWHEANPDLSAWIVSRAPRFGFAASMQTAVAQYGHLTDGQVEAVRRLIAKDAERDAAREAEKAAIVTAAPAIGEGIKAIEEAFATAAAAGMKKPKLRLAGFTFSPAPLNGQNAGAIYVKAAGEYAGKIVNSRFVRAFVCEHGTAAEIVAVASAPRESAVAYGRRTGSCACCGRELSDPVSVEAGIGPVCATKFGW